MNTLKSKDFKFGRSTFVEVLQSIAGGYQFVTFGDVARGLLTDQPCCLMRHDVDASMDFAIDMAEIEAERGIRTTYFVMLRSPLYNLMSRHSAAALLRLSSLGHEIGLHFDAACTPSPGKTVQDELSMELKLLSELAGQQVNAFSFHQPTEAIIRMRLSYPAVINTYNPDQLEEFRYISDSNRVWRDLDPFQLAASGWQKIQILLHPMWWMCEAQDVLDCWDQTISANFRATQAQLLATERAYGPPRQLKLLR
jgi:hypothetical protein